MNSLKLGTALASLLWASNSLACTVGSVEKVNGYDIILAEGQSNEVGYGFGNYPPLDPTILAQITQLGRWGDQDMEVIPVGYDSYGTLTDGLQFWGQQPTGTGMSHVLSFAEQYIKHGYLTTGRKLLIIPGAHGSTSILQWNGEQAQPDNVRAKNTTLEDDIVDRAFCALSLPGMNNRIVLFDWQQGETDLLNSTRKHPTMDVKTYKTKLSAWFAHLRTRLPGNWPIVAGSMPAHWLTEKPQATIKLAFNRAIQQVTQHEQNAIVVPVDPTLTSDAEVGFPELGYQHWSAAAQVKEGKHIFYRWQQLYGPNPLTHKEH